MTSHTTLFTCHAQQPARTGSSQSQPAQAMSSPCTMAALDLRKNFPFAHQMICKQHIVLNHVFFRYESNLEIRTRYITINAFYPCATEGCTQTISCDISAGSLAVADPRGRPGASPLQTKIFLISCSFSEILANLYAGAPVLEGWRPLLWEIPDPPLNDHVICPYLTETSYATENPNRSCHTLVSNRIYRMTQSGILEHLPER